MIRFAAAPLTLQWLVYALAAYRAVRLLVVDDLLEPLRAWLRRHGWSTIVSSKLGGNVEARVEPRRRRAPIRFASSVLDCPWCCGVWVAGATVALGYCSATAPAFGYVALAGAFAAVAGFAHQISERLG